MNSRKIEKFKTLKPGGLCLLQRLKVILIYWVENCRVLHCCSKFQKICFSLSRLKRRENSIF